MPRAKKPSNRHNVDRLFDLREQIKSLQADADFLRAEIMRSGDFVGAEYMAVPKSQVQRRLDRQALELTFGKDVIEKHCKDVPVTTLNLFKKADVRRSESRSLLDD